MIREFVVNSAYSDDRAPTRAVVEEILARKEVQEQLDTKLLQACMQRGLLQPSQVQVRAMVGGRMVPVPIPDGPLIPWRAKGTDRSVMLSAEHRRAMFMEFDPRRVGVDPHQPGACETEEDMVKLLGEAVSRVLRSERVQLALALTKLQIGLSLIEEQERGGRRIKAAEPGAESLLSAGDS